MLKETVSAKKKCLMLDTRCVVVMNNKYVSHYYFKTCDPNDTLRINSIESVLPPHIQRDVDIMRSCVPQIKEKCCLTCDAFSKNIVYWFGDI